MIPGFVELGVLAVLFQVAVIAGFYGYLRWRQPVPPAESRLRAERLLLGGVVLAIGGQLATLGAVASLRTASLLSVRRAIGIQNAGLLVTLVGYGVLVVGFGLYLRRRA